ncbi:bifunctional diaminohydroxyphosphoribosylaminopyrimidine deaminase/5-amino-6-(5-phosphoribosylamino)uracil reductase RibD [Mitsuaria sp. WAJ17]|nr:bifunctional diaminohydroxyphosphoribosylaminopyrimidine deaminase/5-amino-6-(5-phosphoribosylamino)uracil reductase RibD [Mitsuaria sp. WAJ17]
MELALTLSRRAIGLSEPNPRVGCVITDPAGRLLGAGHTQQAGGPHAEVMALRDARARGHGEAALAGAHVYVTLEPCAHHGRTPPCCEALAAARVGRVHLALLDPNPLVAGKGRAHLEAAGITCEQGLGAVEAREINIGFLSRMVRSRPYVRMKIAASLDGRTALPDGRSQWITGPGARQDGQWWRQRASAILTGLGTVRDDDPRLDLRLPGTEAPPLQPLRVIVDSRLQTPANARILQPPGRVLLVHAGHPSTTPWPEGVETLALPAGLKAGLPAGQSLNAPTVAQVELSNGPQVDLPALLAELGRRGVNELHVEAGATLNGALLRAGLVDELLLYLAPTLLGEGRGMAALGLLPELAAAPRFDWLETRPVDGDLRLRLRRPGLGF